MKANPLNTMINTDGEQKERTFTIKALKDVEYKGDKMKKGETLRVERDEARNIMKKRKKDFDVLV